MDSVRDGRPPGARGGIQILGTELRSMAWPRSVRRVCLRLGRDRFDKGVYCLLEISSFRVPSAGRRSNRRMTRRWPGNTTGWFVIAIIPCLTSFLHSCYLPRVLMCFYGCPSSSLLCYTWVSWPEREVIHNATVRRRLPTSMTQIWVPPSVIAAAVLQLAQNQERAAFCWGDATRAVKPDDPWSSFVSVRVPLVEASAAEQ